MLTTLLFHNYHYNYRRFAPYFRRPTTQLNRNWIIYGVFVEIRLEGACIILYHFTVRFFKFEEFQACDEWWNLFSKYWKVVENNFEKLILKSGATD